MSPLKVSEAPDIKKIIGISSILISMWFGPFWICLSLLIVGVLSYFINAIPNKKLLNYSLKEQLFDIFPNVLLVLTMAIPIYLLNFIDISFLWKLVIQVFSGIIIYFLFSVIYKNNSFKLILKYIKAIFRRKKEVYER